MKFGIQWNLFTPSCWQSWILLSNHPSKWTEYPILKVIKQKGLNYCINQRNVWHAIPGLVTSKLQRFYHKPHVGPTMFLRNVVFLCKTPFRTPIRYSEPTLSPIHTFSQREGNEDPLWVAFPIISISNERGEVSFPKHVGWWLMYTVGNCQVAEMKLLLPQKLAMT